MIARPSLVPTMAVGLFAVSLATSALVATTTEVVNFRDSVPSPERARSAAMRYSRLRLSRHAAIAATRIPRTPASPGRHDASEPAATTGLSSMGSSGETPLRICRSAIRWLRRSQRSSQLIIAVSQTNPAAPSGRSELGLLEEGTRSGIRHRSGEAHGLAACTVGLVATQVC